MKHIHNWYREDYPTLTGADRPLECVQEPGDLVFAPDMWGHGVVYVKDSVGIAFLYHV